MSGVVVKTYFFLFIKIEDLIKMNGLPDNRKKTKKHP